MRYIRKFDNISSGEVLDVVKEMFKRKRGLPENSILISFEEKYIVLIVKMI
jgi:hypothetical protein